LLAYQRLLFYRARAQGRSFATIKIETLAAHALLGIPHDFSASQVSVDIFKQTRAEIDQAYALSATHLDRNSEAVFKSQKRINHLESVLGYALRINYSTVWQTAELDFQRAFEEEKTRLRRDFESGEKKRLRTRRKEVKRTTLLDRLKKLFSPKSKRDLESK
jgi:hypothetical protein